MSYFRGQRSLSLGCLHDTTPLLCLCLTSLCLSLGRLTPFKFPLDDPGAPPPHLKILDTVTSAKCYPVIEGASDRSQESELPLFSYSFQPSAGGGSGQDVGSAAYSGGAPECRSNLPQSPSDVTLYLGRTVRPQTQNSWLTVGIEPGILRRFPCLGLDLLSLFRCLHSAPPSRQELQG